MRTYYLRDRMMSDRSDSPERAEAGAVERLRKLGLTEYEAWIYVALLRLGAGTAREIAEATSVPRTRVYDSVEALEERGLVDVQYASPKLFQPISRESAVRQFRLEYDETLDELLDLLTALEPAGHRHEQAGVWTVTGQRTIDDRVQELVAEANEEIVCTYTNGLPTDETIEHLAAADGQGTTIRVTGASPAARERLRAAIPDAEVYDTLWEWSDASVGRLLMIDRETLLVSVVLDGDSLTETAIWGSGEHNSLVVVLRAIFDWWLDSSDQSPDA